MMSEEDADVLLERALEIVLARPEGWRDVMRDLAGESPRATISDLSVAVARAGRAIEDAFVDGDQDGLPPQLYRLAALSSLDAWMMESRGWSDATVGDLALYRRLHDDPFLGDAFPHA